MTNVCVCVFVLTVPTRSCQAAPQQDSEMVAYLISSGVVFEIDISDLPYKGMSVRFLPSHGDKELTCLSQLPTCSTVLLHESLVTDNGVQALAGHSSIKHLDLFGTAVSTTGVSFLGSLGQLQYVDVSESKCDDLSVKVFSELPHLIEMRLAGLRITDDGVEYLRRSVSLRRIDLSGTQIGDRGAESVAAMSAIKMVDLSFTDISPRGVSAVCQAPLEGLSLYQVDINQEAAAAIGRCGTLQLLRLGGCSLSSETLKQMSKLRMLTAIDLSNNRLVLDDLQSLAENRPLAVIGARGLKRDANGLSVLRHFPYLTV